MFLVTKSTLLCLRAFALSATINGAKDCLLGLCFGVSFLCCLYVADWLHSYFYYKKKIYVMTADLDNLFVGQENLIERLSKLSSQQRKQYEPEY